MKALTLTEFSLCALAGGFLFVACGDDVTKVTNVTNETVGMAVVESADSLGACDSSNIGTTVFASRESSAYVCAESGWRALSQNITCSAEMLSDSSGYKVLCDGDSIGVVLTGIDGVNGKNGKDAEDGADGIDGTDGTDGKNGVGCSRTDNGDGTVTQVCGETTVTLYKALCGTAPYESTDYRCEKNELVKIESSSSSEESSSSSLAESSSSVAND